MTAQKKENTGPPDDERSKLKVVTNNAKKRSMAKLSKLAAPKLIALFKENGHEISSQGRNKGSKLYIQKAPEQMGYGGPFAAEMLFKQTLEGLIKKDADITEYFNRQQKHKKGRYDAVVTAKKLMDIATIHLA